MHARNFVINFTGSAAVALFAFVVVDEASAQRGGGGFRGGMVGGFRGGMIGGGFRGAAFGPGRVGFVGRPGFVGRRLRRPLGRSSCRVGWSVRGLGRTISLPVRIRLAPRLGLGLARCRWARRRIARHKRLLRLLLAL